MALPPASDGGFRAAERAAQDYVEELLTSAAKVAKRVGAEEASAKHVRMAVEQLYRSGASWTQQAIGTTGALIGGIGGSAFFTFLQDSTPNATAIAISAATTLVGTAGVIVGFMKR